MEELINLYGVIISTISTIFTAFLLNYFQDKIKSTKITILLTILLVSILVLITNFLIQQTIEHNNIVRKFVDPDNFIDGYYYDITKRNDTISHLTMLEIRYVDGRYEVYGEGFNTSAKQTSVFNSINSVYDDKTLFFEYTSTTQNEPYANNLLREIGIDKLHFSNPPDSYQGFYLAYDGGAKGIISGTRIDDDEVEKYKLQFKAKWKSKFFLQVLKNYNE